MLGRMGVRFWRQADILQRRLLAQSGHTLPRLMASSGLCKCSLGRFRSRRQAVGAWGCRSELLAQLPVVDSLDGAAGGCAKLDRLVPGVGGDGRR